MCSRKVGSVWIVFVSNSSVEVGLHTHTYVHAMYALTHTHTRAHIHTHTKGDTTNASYIRKQNINIRTSVFPQTRALPGTPTHTRTRPCTQIHTRAHRHSQVSPARLATADVTVKQTWLLTRLNYIVLYLARRREGGRRWGRRGGEVTGV